MRAIHKRTKVRNQLHERRNGEPSRYDSGPVIYVLIDKIDLNSNKFKDNVKQVVKDLVKKKGRKLSINLFDSADALDLEFKEYGDMSLNRLLTTNEKELLARHYVGTYTGQLETNSAPYTLDFFPAAFRDHKIVGRLVESTELSPEFFSVDSK